MEILYYIIIFILGAAVAWFIQSIRLRAEKRVLTEQNGFLNTSLQEAKSQLSEAQKNIITLTHTLATAQADLANTEKMQAHLKTEFENLANKILEDNTVKFTEQNQKNIGQLLNPLKTQIDDFRTKIDNVYRDDTNDRVALRTQIESLAKLNIQMTEDARNLTLVLKGDSKSQGDWGEMILEKILETSGLMRDQEFTVQASFKGDEGSDLRPDVIINLPENRHFVIDSKVSLTAYERYSSAVEDEDRGVALGEHIQSIRSHVDELVEKKYQDLYQITAPDFVFMFIPIEPALLSAVKEDQGLFSYAFKKNVVLLVPSTLLATLKTVEFMWKQEKQTRNAKEIARRSGTLYDKFVGLYDDLIEIGKKLNSTTDLYHSSLNKLKDGRGNLIKSLEDIKKLGAKTSKELPLGVVQEAEDISNGGDENNSEKIIS
jgi:DNA recombination protein RmuC